MSRRRNRNQRAPRTSAGGVPQVSPGAASELAAALTKSLGVPFSASSSADGVAVERIVSVKIVAPNTVYNGRVQNPDPVLRKHGWGNVCLYDEMERKHPVYAGICNLFADKVCVNNLRWKAGDSSDGQSRWMADAISTLYARQNGRHIINRKAVKGRFYGFSVTGKAGWVVDEETGLLWPSDIYDIPQRYIDFKADGTVLAKRDGYFEGTPVPRETVMLYNFGSRFTPWGEADAQFCYLPLWYAQQVRQFGVRALELFGRPVAWIEVPDNLNVDELNDFERGIQAQCAYYVITRTTNNRYNVTFPTAGILANGAAGKSENDWLRWFYGEVYIYVLGVQMTQDKTGGSRALEDSRLEVIADKTPPALEALAQMYQEDYSNHIWRVNKPSVKRALWPKCEPEIVGDAISGPQLQQAMNALLMFGLDQITDVVTERSVAAAGINPQVAHEMVESMREAKEAGTLKPGQPQRLPDAGDSPEMRNAA